MRTLRLRRARNLQALINDKFEGKQIRFAQATNIHPSYVSSMLSLLRGVEGAKPVTEGVAEKIEGALKLPAGYLSQPSEGEEVEGTASNQANEALLELLGTQSARMATMREAIEHLRDASVSNRTMLEVVCAALVEHDASLEPVFVRVVKKLARQPEGDATAEAVREQAESLAAFVQESSQRVADDARRGSSRTASRKR